CQQTNEDPPTF
nr:immunoglobulin light chain junction region [Mus musculus]